jgi:hypothetical protein
MQKEDVAPSNPLWRWKVLQVVAVMREFEIAFVIASTMGPIVIYRPRRRRVFGRAVLATICIYAALIIAVAAAELPWWIPKRAVGVADAASGAADSAGDDVPRRLRSVRRTVQARLPRRAVQANPGRRGADAFLLARR